MAGFHEFDVVRLVQLIDANRHYAGSEGIKRPPRIGDVGTIVYVAPGATSFIVECVDSSGLTGWLADFADAELELVTPANRE